MRISESQSYQFSQHLQQVEALLDPIRYDRSIDDRERRRLIDEVLAAANARALSLRASTPPALASTELSGATGTQERHRHGVLTRAG